jgi:hypothetical protein
MTTGGGHCSGDLQGSPQQFDGLHGSHGGGQHANDADVVTPAMTMASATVLMSFFIDTLLCFPYFDTSLSHPAQPPRILRSKWIMSTIIFAIAGWQE